MNQNTVRNLVDIFRFVSWIKVIAITGGPCAGKSTFLKMAIKLLEKWGIVVVVVPEVARELISSGIVPWSTDWKKTTGFQKHVIFNILEKEASFYRALLDMDLKDKKIVFLCDRGIVDGAAYCGDEAFNLLLEELGTNRHDATERYDAVIHMVTAAIIGAEEFYVNDEDRHETPEQAAQIDYAIRSAWLTHQHFMLVDNTGSFDRKVLQALLSLERIIPMPETAQEIEKKYLLSLDEEGVRLRLLTQNAQSILIYQDYLDRAGDRPGIECRVRKKVVDGVASFTYTEKTKTKEKGVRGELEEKIDEARYNELLATYRFAGREQIQKTRYKIPFEGTELVGELDVYEEDLVPLVVLEVEFKSVEDMESFVLPEVFGEVKDVTDDKRYSNDSLSRDGLPH